MTTAFRPALPPQHRVDVVEIAIGEDARQVDAGHRNDERHRAGGDHQLVVGDGFAGARDVTVRRTVDGDDLVPL
jgi:hypothetical protein